MSETACNNPLALCKTSKHEKFWMDDASELYKDNNYIKFIPKYEMTREEQLNSLSRCAIYMLILLILFRRSESWLYIPITILIIAIMLNYFNKYDKDGKRKDLQKILNIRAETREEEKEGFRKEYAHDGDVKITNPDIDPIDFNQPEEDVDILGNKKDYKLESGYYDSNGQLRMGTKEKLNKFYEKGPDPSLYTIDELLDYEKNTCRKSTMDNPMMNPNITEFGNNNDPPAACNADDDEIKESIKVNFNHQLFRDVDELWERENSQRQFYTMPNTAIPNNQTEFANWLYGGATACKSDSTACLRYDDLRTTRRH